MNSIVATQPSILFVSHDRGESNNFKAIIPFLKKAHIDYNIIGYGQALNVFQGDKHLIKLKGNPTKLTIHKLVSNI